MGVRACLRVDPSDGTWEDECMALTEIGTGLDFLSVS